MHPYTLSCSLVITTTLSFGIRGSPLVTTSQEIILQVSTREPLGAALYSARRRSEHPRLPLEFNGRRFVDNKLMCQVGESKQTKGRFWSLERYESDNESPRCPTSRTRRSLRYDEWPSLEAELLTPTHSSLATQQDLLTILM